MSDKDKLEKAVKLADAMYYAAQYMTTDASRLRKAMYEYHQFIITEYNKQEPAINREDIINSEQYKVSRASVDWYQAHQDADCLDGFEAGAQWQKTQDQQTIELAEEHAMLAGMMQEREKMMKDAVEGYVSATICLAKHCPTDIAEIQVRDSKTAAKVGEKVKVIIIKE